jgi:hypothetical protein
MSPLPCWLAGAQSVALNFSNNDVPVQLHFALFNASTGYVLKPVEMRHAAEDVSSRSSLCVVGAPCLTKKGQVSPHEGKELLRPRLMSQTSLRAELLNSELDERRCKGEARRKRGSSISDSNEGETRKEDVFWPPPRDRLHRASIEVLSLHNLPKVCLLR